MKFCAKCGTQMNDEVEKCPQCGFPVFDPTSVEAVQQKPPKKKVNKLPVIILTTVIATVVVTLCVISLISQNGSSTTDMEIITTTEAVQITTESDDTIPPVTETTPTISPTKELPSSVCPAQEYGNHSWSAATCVEPAKCDYCGVYKDDKLGHHKFWYLEDIDEEACFWCDMLREDYDNEKG